MLISQSLAASTNWSIEGVHLQTVDESVQLNVDALNVQGVSFADIQYRCPGRIKLYPRHRCAEAGLAFTYAAQPLSAAGLAEVDLLQDAWQFDLQLEDHPLGIQMNAEWPHAVLHFEQFNPLQMISQFSGLPEWTTALSAELSGSVNYHLTSAEVTGKQIRFKGLSYEYSDDIIAAELSGTVNVRLSEQNQRLELVANLDQGEILINELYVNFAAYPMTIEAELSGLLDTQMDFDASFSNQQSLSASVSGTMQQDQVKIKEASINVPDSHHFNQQILASMLRIYGFGQTEMSGGFGLDAAFDEQGRLKQWKLGLNDFYLLNNKRKLQADALDGTVYWGRGEVVENSWLKWRDLVLAGMPVKQSAVDFTLIDQLLQLNGPHDFPVFDGSIQIRDLRAEGLLSDAVDLSLNASIKPISLALITEKMGWPQMSGNISGEIPGLVKKGQVIEFDGGLGLSVFQGQMKVENLSMERLFGVAPVIAADISFEGFDLALLTETFGFGRITGLLSGEVNELRITNWKTDRLDARVYTVKTPGVKQTISQRAIDNISSLGGIKGAISNTFLRFFDDFRYQKIKLSCVLHNSVCQIGGLKNQGNQFVIVEGGGIPKINIVGYVRSINWEEFMDRLLNANYGN